MSGGAPTDVEISRGLNALGTTLNDQRPASFLVERFQQIVDGATGGERKLRIVSRGPLSGSVLSATDDRTLATLGLQDGRWGIARVVDAKGSSRGVPDPGA